MNEVREFLQANKHLITHFRPKRWCGVEQLLPYNRRENIPLIQSGPVIYDTQENAALIREVLGPGFIEEPFQGIPGSRNY